jgi:hypothetical protein
MAGNEEFTMNPDHDLHYPDNQHADDGELHLIYFTYFAEVARFPTPSFLFSSLRGLPFGEWRRVSSGTSCIITVL